MKRIVLTVTLLSCTASVAAAQTEGRVSVGASFNVTTGADRNNDTNVNDRPAGLARNSERQPDTAACDLRLSRTFRLRGRQRLEGMIEAFNVFNHVNVIAVNGTFGQGVIPLASFGQVTVAGDPRQIQFGVRWSF